MKLKKKTNTEIVEEPKEDDSENNKTVEDEPSNEEPKEDDSENNKTVEDEPSNEENNSENEIMENKTWCDISEDTLILGLNYFVCIDNSQTKLNPSIRFESEAKTDTFFVDGYASTYVRIRVGYDNKKLNFSSVNDTYTITDVTREGSNIYITIKWK